MFQADGGHGGHGAGGGAAVNDPADGGGDGDAPGVEAGGHDRRHGLQRDAVDVAGVVARGRVGDGPLRRAVPGRAGHRAGVGTGSQKSVVKKPLTMGLGRTVQVRTGQTLTLELSGLQPQLHGQAQLPEMLGSMLAVDSEMTPLCWLTMALATWIVFDCDGTSNNKRACPL